MILQPRNAGSSMEVDFERAVYSPFSQYLHGVSLRHSGKRGHRTEDSIASIFWNSANLHWRKRKTTLVVEERNLIFAEAELSVNTLQ